MTTPSFATVSLLSRNLSTCQQRGINYDVNTVKETKFLSLIHDKGKAKPIDNLS